MDRFARWVIRYRLMVVVFVALLTVAGTVSVVLFSRVESDISKYLPPDDPVVVRFNEAGDRFGAVAVAMVAIESDEIFTRDGLQLIDKLTREFDKIPGITWVISLTNVDDVKQIQIDGEKAVSVKKLLDPGEIPSDQEEMNRLREYVLSKERLVGTVISEDSRVANIAVHISSSTDRVDAAREIEERARHIAPDAKLYFSGFPFWMKTMSDMILGDMTLLVPFVTLVIVIILLLSFRSLRGVLLPLSTVLISSVWAMGLMAALDIPITTLSNAIPVLLIALGTAYAIHLLHKYNEVADQHLVDARGVREAIVDVMIPICLAGLTTVIGFLSFLTSSLVFIQQTGVIAAFGIFSAMLITLTFLPAILSWLKPRSSTSSTVAVHTVKGLSRLADKIGRAVIENRRWLLAFSLVVAVVAAAFLPSLNRRFDMVSYFPEESEVRRADDMMRTNLGGNVPLWVEVEGPTKNPYTLKTMFLIEKFLRTIDDVNSPQSVASLVAEINDVMNGRTAVPATTAGVGNLWLNLEGKDVLRQFVDPDREHALVQAVCATADTAVLRNIVSQVDEFLDGLPTRVIAVDMQRGKSPLLEPARRFGRKQAARMAYLDIVYRLDGGMIDDLSAKTVESWIEEGLAGRPENLDRDTYHRIFLEFMVSDESDLVFPSSEMAEQVASVLASMLSKGKQDVSTIEKSIADNIPVETLDEDPEAPAYLAESILARAEELEKLHLLDHLTAMLMAKLPAEVSGRELLEDELRGDLAQLEDDVVYLPIDQANGQGLEKSVRVSFHQTGMHHISVNVDDRIVFSQLSSLGLAVAMATILLMIQFKSILAGLLGMLPMLLTLLVNFGVMGAFRIDLEPATVLIASMVVGVGIDYTIHFMSRTRLEMLRKGEPADALEVTLRTAGRAILINAITVACGQLVFLAGDLIPMQTFGVLLALAMLVSAISAVTIMPAILMATQPRFLNKSRSLKT